MVAVPAAIVQVNSDISGSVQETLVRQLYIDIVLTGDQFDANVAADSEYPNKIKQLNNRLLIVRPADNYTNRDLVDIVLFIKEGLSATAEDKYGRPLDTWPLVYLHWGQLGLY